MLVRNEKYPDHAQHRDDPDEFIPADVIADISDLPDWSQLSRPLNRKAIANRCPSGRWGLPSARPFTHPNPKGLPCPPATGSTVTGSGS